ncbi:NAD(P)H-dependent glycerol-3-phosphate dehydrogenase [Antarctobacter sp.]|uniref:NAD(P)H-dependent glycerol-3-phosphate dehydrogenase n=1 Tax=Antarctobacter sp. TaxID=1872577 RepID=UPI002B26D04F|nr:NAD(P)H-dependent glycerol-3-phosphate dehydrogenase [Antarctobacter sp.]
MSVAVLGAGAFGTALAVALSRKGPVALWARNAGSLMDTRQSPRLPNVPLPDAVAITDDLDRATACKTLLLSVPMQQLSGLLDRITTPMQGHALVACCKGIDLTEGVGPSALIARHQPDATPAVLTGPSFAADIARGLPTALTLACGDGATGRGLQAQLSTPVLRLYRSDDMIGAELGGALKNVIAIACGACIGAGLGDSARAALMTRGFAEMVRLATALGAQADTLAGLSGLGDLTLTCTSDLSRNFRYGLALGRGEPFDPAVTVEGAATAQAAARLAQDHALPLPVCAAVSDLTQGRLTVRQAMDTLLSRPLKDE